jgi:branched-chain amino acid transport system substrate-binding protein
MTRRLFNAIAGAAALAGAALLAAGAASAQDAPKSVKIGYAIALSGPEAPGAGLTTLPNYRLWIKEVNDAGGLMLKKYGKRVPIEPVELDDTSDQGARMRLTEKLMAVDKVDLVLTPWSTGANFAVAPLYAKYGYPQVMGTAGSDKMEEMVAKFPTMFFFLAKNADQTKALVDMMAAAKKDGKINDKVALFIVQAPFGQEYIASLKPSLDAAGFKVAYEAVYDAKATDLSTQIKAAKAAGPDTMIALSYPPDTFMITEQSLANDFNPKIKFVGVGGAFPPYKGKFGDKIEGVFSLGGWDPTFPAMQDYFKRHTAFTGGKEPDRWASSATYAGLQALQQAIENVGEIDRAKIIQELKTGTFKTIAGDLKLPGNRDAQAWLIGQWQGGEFYGVAPSNRAGAKTPAVK